MEEKLAQIILSTALKETTKNDLLRVFKIKENLIPIKIEEILNNAIENQISNDVEYSIILGSLFEYPKNINQYLHKLLLTDWHISHEDILFILEKNKKPESIEFIDNAIKLKEKLEYLDYDDYGSYYKKCFWALYEINTIEADKVILNYTKNKDEIIANTAKERYEEVLKRRQS